MALVATALSWPTLHVEEMEQLAEYCLYIYEGAQEPYREYEDEVKRVAVEAVANVDMYKKDRETKYFTLKKTEIPRIPRKPLTDWLVKLLSTP